MYNSKTGMLFSVKPIYRKPLVPDLNFSVNFYFKCHGGKCNIHFAKDQCYPQTMLEGPGLICFDECKSLCTIKKYIYQTKKEVLKLKLFKL